MSMFANLTVRFVTWAISRHDVQQAIVNQFENNTTPMCKALNSAIVAHIESHTVDADYVEGLDRYISNSVENALSDFTIDFDKVDGLASAINEALDEKVGDLELKDLDGFDDEVERVVNDMDHDGLTEAVMASIAKRIIHKVLS